MMLPPVFAHMKAAPAVLALLGNPPRVYAHGTAPQGAVVPYVVWSVIGAAPQSVLDDVPGMDLLPLQLDCYAADGAAVTAMARAVRDALEPHATLTGIPVDQRETETGLYRLALQFDYWLAR